MTKKIPILAVFTKNRLNPAYHGARIAAERVAARFGGQVLHFVPDTPDNIEQQIALLHEAIGMRPDAIVLVPVHMTAVDAAVREVRAAGIPLFNCINRLQDPEDYISFVGADDVEMTRRVARRLFEALAGRGRIVVLEGTPGTITARDRLRGFLDEAARYPQIEIVERGCGMFLYDEGRQAMRRLLEAHARIDGVAACNDSMALGAIDALRLLERRALVVGVNAVPEAVQALKRGELLATADFDAFKIAALAAEAALRHLRGEAVPKEILPAVQVVDRDNCAHWDKPMEARDLPEWDAIVRP